MLLDLRHRDFRDDNDSFLAAAQNNAKILDDASFRIQTDLSIVLALISNARDYFDGDWLKYAHIDKLSDDEQKQVADAILNCPAPKFFFRSVLEQFSSSIRDDRTLMLKFVEKCYIRESLTRFHRDEKPREVLGWCSERLRKDKEVIQAAVTKNINEWKHALGPIRKEYDNSRTISTVLVELERGLYFDNVPDAMKIDPTIVKAALEAGRQEAIYHLPESMFNDLDPLVSLVKDGVYIPDRLLRNEEVALELLRAGYL
jgi:hypothetical protein